MNKEGNNRSSVRLQVFFEEPFWVGIFEKYQNGELSVSKVTFGAEPKDYEVQKFILDHYIGLRFSPTVTSVVEEKININPKRLQRQVNKQIQNIGIGTKSQQALKLQQEQLKTERKVKSRKRREEEQTRLFELKQQKKKEKHKGR